MDSSTLLLQLNQYQSKSGIEKIALAILHNEQDFKQLFTFIKKHKGKVAERSSWVIRTCGQIEPEFVKKHFKQIIQLLESEVNDPVLRNLSGIFIDHGIPESLEIRALNFAIKTLLDFKRAVAVHANALGMLNLLSSKHPELKQEIILITNGHPAASYASFKSRLFQAQKSMD